MNTGSMAKEYTVRSYKARFASGLARRQRANLETIMFAKWRFRLPAAMLIFDQGRQGFKIKAVRPFTPVSVACSVLLATLG